MSGLTQSEAVGGLVFENGARWSGDTITFSFAKAGSSWDAYERRGPEWREFYGNEPYKPEYAVLDEVQKASFREAIASIQRLIAVRLVETDDVAAPGQIRVAITNTGYAGYAYQPPAPGQTAAGIDGDVWLNKQWVGNSLQYSWYANGITTPLLVHEFSHALGLDHPNEGARTLPPPYANGAYTVMSSGTPKGVLNFAAVDEGHGLTLRYSDIPPFVKGPLVYDIAALQSLYGANPTTALGDDTYRLAGPRSMYDSGEIIAIYDAGGVDTVDASDQVRSSVIDLTPGAYSSLGIWDIPDQLAHWTAKVPTFADRIAQEFGAGEARGDLYTWRDNLGIAFGTTIENAVGGDGADTITGNIASNRLNGGEGGDRMFAGAGDDTLFGEGGSDYLRGEEGDDRIYGGDAFDDLHGNAGADFVAGNGGDDWVVGGKDDDQLFGDAGDDIVYGNLGDDICRGDEGADLVRGGQGNDQVVGGAGADWLSGDRGDDTVTGGAGADVFHGSQDAGIDRITDFSQAEGDRIQLDPSTTYTLRQAGADTVIDMGGGHQMVLGTSSSRPCRPAGSSGPDPPRRESTRASRESVRLRSVPS